MASFGQIVWAFRNPLLIFLIPIVMLPLPLVIPTTEAACGYTIIVMALYWCTEALPLAVTALIPVLFFPMFKIMVSQEVCKHYLKDTNMLLIGGLMVAIAVEQWNLHKRIALRVLLIVGVKPALLMLGFMGVTAFLSMWISNTATTAMMVPIAQAVLDQLNVSGSELENEELENGFVNKGLELAEKGSQMSDGKHAAISSHKENQVIISNKKHSPPHPAEEEQERSPIPNKEKEHTKLSKGMSLSVCYSASIGGAATLTGTTPNLIMVGQLKQLFPDSGDIVNFATWFGFSFPVTLIMLFLTWIWLQIVFLGFNFKKNFGCGKLQTKKEIAAYEVIKQEVKKLGPMTFAEIAVLILFIFLVLLWFTRDPGFIPGWASVLFNSNNKDFVTDATVVIFISVIMFIIPSAKPRLPYSKHKYGPAPSLLNWKLIQEKLPWNVVILLGGGFALAEGSEESGLSTWLGSQLIPLQNIPPWAIVIVLCLLVATFTECASNTATTSLFLPILASMAQRIGIHPLYIMLPCTICASFAFMLPVATPPNSIVFSYGYLKVSDMAKTGIIVNILGVLTISLAINTWGQVLFNLDSFPSWANSTKIP
uniref:Solute carrier family 13 member 5 n=1 Tax=Callorhinchus milii TaxID=7868 RepID=A0A4W3IV30_CALMI